MNNDKLPTLDEIRLMIERRSREIELVQIANAANGTITWLKQVMSGAIKDPSYKRMKGIYEFLKSKEI